MRSNNAQQLSYSSIHPSIHHVTRLRESKSNGTELCLAGPIDAVHSMARQHKTRYSWKRPGIDMV